MQLQPHVEALRAELASLGSLGDEHVAVAAERLSQALGSTLGLRLLEILSRHANPSAVLERGFAAYHDLPPEGALRGPGALARLHRAGGGGGRSPRRGGQPHRPNQPSPS